jgi:hypothetical protein
MIMIMHKTNTSELARSNMTSAEQKKHELITFNEIIATVIADTLVVNRP